jgi:uncharacterized protein (TIGR03083 family)
MDEDAAGSDINNTNYRNLDYLAHLARESTRFLEAMRQTHPGARVPTCPDWDADDLLWHLGEVQWFWSTIAGRGLTTHDQVEAIDRTERPGDRDGLLAFFVATSGDLLHNLKAATPDTVVWTWSDEQTVAFIRRRQAHEALIHRVDAELVADERTPIDPDLGTDGVDEVLRIMYAGSPPWGHFTPDPEQTVRIHATDTDRSWLVTLGHFVGTAPDGTAHDGADLTVAGSDGGTSDTSGSASATVRGAGADLDCWLWHRPPMGRIERSGDPQVLERLGQAIAAGID